MAEQETLIAEKTETKVEPTGKIVKAGAVEKMQFNTGQQSASENKTDGNEDHGTQKTQAEIDAEKLAAANTGNQPATETKELTPDEIKALYEKHFPTTPELTAEQVAEKEKAVKKRMLDLYIENGGTPASFVAMEELANADLTQLSDSQLVSELKAGGFNDEQIAALRKERYYQLDEAELAEIEDETERADILKKKDFVDKRRLAKAEQTKNQATTFFDTLKKAIDNQDLQVTKEKEFSSKVDEHFKAVPRKLTIQLGKADDADLAPIDFDIPESVIEKVSASLKDAAQRKQNYNTSDSGLNIAKLADLELRSALLDELVKTSVLEGQTRQVKIFESTFGGKKASDIGVGADGVKRENKGGKGTKFVSAGQTQRFQPQRN